MQKAMATLFDVDRSLITKHLKNIFDYRELIADRVCAKFAHTAEDDKIYNTMFCLRNGLKAQQAQVFTCSGQAFKERAEGPASA